MKKGYAVLFVLHAVVGLGAMAGGLAAITNPQAPLGAPLELLKHSPFRDYLIPGILLFAVIGVGNLLSGAVMLFHRNWRWQGYLSSVFSWALVIWIVVQCIMLRTVAFLHVLFFCIGAAEAALSMLLLSERRLFPANLLLGLYERVTKKR